MYDLFAVNQRTPVSLVFIENFENKSNFFHKNLFVCTAGDVHTVIVIEKAALGVIRSHVHCIFIYSNKYFYLSSRCLLWKQLENDELPLNQDQDEFFSIERI